MGDAGGAASQHMLDGLHRRRSSRPLPTIIRESSFDTIPLVSDGEESDDRIPSPPRLCRADAEAQFEEDTRDLAIPDPRRACDGDRIAEYQVLFEDAQNQWAISGWGDEDEGDGPIPEEYQPNARLTINEDGAAHRHQAFRAFPSLLCRNPEVPELEPAYTPMEDDDFRILGPDWSREDETRVPAIPGPVDMDE